MAVGIEGARAVSNPLSASATEMESMQLLHDIFLRLSPTRCDAALQVESRRDRAAVVPLHFLPTFEAFVVGALHSVQRCGVSLRSR
jgi:hypothetical protein